MELKPCLSRHACCGILYDCLVTQGLRAVKDSSSAKNNFFESCLASRYQVDSLSISALPAIQLILQISKVEGRHRSRPAPVSTKELRQCTVPGGSASTINISTLPRQRSAEELESQGRRQQPRSRGTERIPEGSPYMDTTTNFSSEQVRSFNDPLSEHPQLSERK